MNEVKAAQLPEQKNLVENLWEGNLGLSMTYWVYGILGGIVWGVGILALRLSSQNDIANIIFFMMMAYYIVVYVGIWKAANKFTGKKLWSILAKFVVIMSILQFVIAIGLQQYKDRQKEQEEQNLQEWHKQSQIMEQFKEEEHTKAYATAIKVYPFKNKISVAYTTTTFSNDYLTSTSKKHYLLIPQIEVRIFTKDSDKFIKNIQKNKKLIEEGIHNNLSKNDYKNYVGIEGENNLARDIRGIIDEFIFSFGQSNEFNGGVSGVFFPQSFSVR